MTHDETLSALASAGNWHKSSFSGGENGGCVEVASVPGYVGIRDTKPGAGSPILAFTTDEWEAFLTGVRNGEFPDGGPALSGIR